MNIKIKPRKLKGTIDAVSSKSYAHRLIVASMLSEKESKITINGFSDDIMHTLNCVSALGGNYSIADNMVKITPVTRIVMSAAIAATIAEDDVITEGFEAINKSYPSFFDEYKKLGGEFDVF